MEASVSRKWKTIDMAYIALFAVLMAVCSWISIPAVVPFTLQTFGVFVAVSVLGGKRGTLAVVLYLLMGIVGLPVFAGFSGGLGVLLGSTGGYIIGFVFTALVMWLIERLLGTKTWVLALSMLLGLAVCYAFGTAWFLVVYTKTPAPSACGRRWASACSPTFSRTALNRPCAGHPQASGRCHPAAVTSWTKQSFPCAPITAFVSASFRGRATAGLLWKTWRGKRPCWKKIPSSG